MKARTLLLSSAVATMALLATPAVSRGELDLPGINARLDNLEARTTNNEKDIKVLQASTNTQAASDHVDVPAVPESTPAPEAAPATPTEPTATPAASPSPDPIQYGPVGHNTEITN